MVPRRRGTRTPSDPVGPGPAATTAGEPPASVRPAGVEAEPGQTPRSTAAARWHPGPHGGRSPSRRAREPCSDLGLRAAAATRTPLSPPGRGRTRRPACSVHAAVASTSPRRCPARRSHPAPPCGTGRRPDRLRSGRLAGTREGEREQGRWPRATGAPCCRPATPRGVAPARRTGNRPGAARAGLRRTAADGDRRSPGPSGGRRACRTVRGPITAAVRPASVPSLCPVLTGASPPTGSRSAAEPRRGRSSRRWGRCSRASARSARPSR